MVYSFFSVTVIPFFLAIIRDNDISFNYPVRIEILSITFLVSTLNPAKTIDKFFTVLSASAKSFF
jgi:hypothetical protein